MDEISPKKLATTIWGVLVTLALAYISIPPKRVDTIILAEHERTIHHDWKNWKSTISIGNWARCEMTHKGYEITVPWDSKITKDKVVTQSSRSTALSHIEKPTAERLVWVWFTAESLCALLRQNFANTLLSEKS